MNNIAMHILQDVAKKQGSTVARIRGRQRTQRLVEIRIECMREIHIFTDLSYTEIGKLFDNRDRTTVLRLLGLPVRKN